MAQLDDRDPRRIQSAGLDDRPLHSPGNQPVTAHERANCRDLGVHQRCDDDRRGVFCAEQQLHDSREPFSDNGFVGRGAEIGELERHLRAAARPANL